jgi:F420-dependent oxidoreductase-like protein
MGGIIMRLGTSLGQWTGQGGIAAQVARAQEAEQLGYHSIWSAEVYGADALTPLVWIAAHTTKINLGTGIVQMTARVPAMMAMTAASIDLLSGGRFLLGIGASGPQVVEGWHGVAYGNALKRTREYVNIINTVLKRETPLEHHGEHYDIPLRGGTGLGKPLKLIVHPQRTHIPIYIAAIGPKNVALAAEIADGWLPIFFAPQKMSMFKPWLEEGFAKAGNGKSLEDFDIAPSVSVIVGDDVKACLAQVKPQLAFYIGGMGARNKNFYNDLACRYGYEAEAKQIQDLFLSGKRDEATATVPDALADEVSLCGPKERIKERLSLWKEAGITTLRVGGNADTLRMMAELVL